MITVCVLVLGICQGVGYAAGQESGSLLLFPYFDSNPTALTIITVTNTNSSVTIDPVTELPEGTIDVMFKYIDEIGCTPEDRVERLTPNDTISIVAAKHNPEDETGFLYVYAQDPKTGLPVSFDFLIGMETIFDSGLKASFNLSPLVFKAGSVGPDDHLLALDGQEYEMMPDEIHIPRFFGQGPGLVTPSPFVSEIIFINLTGGAMFTAAANLLVYNDNEQIFSSTIEFDCWDRVDLIDVSAATGLAFLQSSNHDPDEMVFFANQLETGWIRINGDYAYSAIINYLDPAIYAILVDHRISGGYATASLPFEKGEQDNGQLWSTSPMGN